METDWIWAYLSQLMYQIPLWLVYLVASIVALVRWQKHPLASLLTVLAIAVMVITSMITGAVYLWLPRQLDEFGWTGEQLSWAFAIVRIISVLVHTVAMSMLLTAIFIGRSPAKQPAKWEQASPFAKPQGAP